MRVASRVIGVVLALTGLGFIGLPAYVYALGQESSDAVSWIIVTVAVGVGCLLAARHFLKLDVNALDDTEVRPASRFATYLISHRRELRLIALVGFAISLVSLGTACFGADWPGPWAAWPVVLILVGLAVIEGKIAKGQTEDHLDWRRVPEQVRPLLKAIRKGGVVAFLILLLLLESNHWLHLPLSSRIVQDALLVLLFAWEMLFFQYGALRAVEIPGKVLNS